MKIFCVFIVIFSFYPKKNPVTCAKILLHLLHDGEIFQKADVQSVSRCNKLFYKRRSCKKNLLQSGNAKIDLLQFPILLQDLLQLFYYIISLLSYYYLYFVTNVTNVTKFQSKNFFILFSD